MPAEIFAVDGAAVTAILAMAAATFATRAGGFFIIRRLRPTPFLERWLGAIPGAMFVALVVPAVVNGGPAAWAGAAVTAVAARMKAPLMLALLLGVAVVAAFRASGWTG